MPDLLNEIPECCSSCKHLYKMVTEEPCFACDNRCKTTSKWEPNDNLKDLYSKGDKIT